ncbi:hypothetical protein SEVIR_9G303400v4 [Setaria viridis]|uniref:Uncharacterized protein n=2 Tax=Setaria TaxID=4554 RepID=A0A368SM16_SETIT|nr:uncharacterized protein LOC101761875 [Setaria italica]XP_034576334.1 uncharacterized protein LOC117839990 [Setaria viridis]RCV43477.1 hypothetical protein SETIT_9G297400v2 [Setaria italica]TKV94561.1 hypothetical protein SEVIR_9G303400v2 [Setaria viridis]
MNVDPQIAAASQEKSKGSPFSGAVADFDASSHNPSTLEVMPLQMVAPIVSQNEALVVFGPAHPLVPYSDDKDDNSDDVEILEGPVVIPASHKRRARKMKEALEDKFLHCSKRLNHDLQGFRDAASKE